MKHNLEKRFSTFDLILVLALIAVLLINIAVIGSLPAKGMRKASKDAVTVTGAAPGKVGDVTVEIVADADNIYSVTVVEQNETPGIGSLAVEQLPAAIGTANSLAVDGIATATVTSDAIKAAIANALTEAGFDPANFGYVAPEPEPEVELAGPVASEDGKVTVQGKGTGIGGDVIVEIVADENTIYEVTILEQNETPGIGSVAAEQLPGTIVETNSIAFDAVTGATVTSTAIRTAITEALTSAGFDPANFGGTAPAAAAEEAAPVEAAAPAEIPADAVTVTGKGAGIGGDVVVEVVTDGENIYAVTVVEQNETPGIGSVAAEKLPGAIVEANSIDVDGITGATVTSTAIKTAITEALASLNAAPAEWEATPAEEEAPAEEPAPVKEAALAEPVTVQAVAEGKNGPIVVEVTTDGSNILDVKVLESSETVGVGAVAVDWLPARIVEANSVEVDGISGATITSDAIKAAVVQAVENALNGETGGAPIGSAHVQANVEGKNGPMVVDVKVVDGVITDVNVLENSETQGVGSVAVEWLPARIVEANSVEVDGISGATVTSDAIKAAVVSAIEAAKSGAPAAPVTVTAEAAGKNGPIVVEVTTDGKNVTDVKVLESSETQGVGSVAVEWLPARIVEANSVDVDGVTGATVTSDAIKTAVREAMDKAA
ncbi:MAG: FMN-binding protein [Oscillospiraceae bacterium]|nr:FMN-binding protein [Oscillospiraceae bacterium]MBR0207347.1 FMN-binding protein [Oscillospiraceae bacterium]